MRLVTYDRAGVRRLGALVEDPHRDGARPRPVVLDLAAAVGHPAFPTSMEDLVARSGGTMIEAAEDAAAREDNAQEFAVGRPRLLVPFVPPSRTPILGPRDEPPWPRFQAYLDHSPELGCVVARTGHDLSPRQARAAIFGYVLVVRWVAATGRRVSVGLSLGPWLVTPADLDLRAGEIRSRVDGRPAGAAALDPARWIFPDLVSQASSQPGGVRAGTLLTTTLGRTARGLGIPLEPGTRIHVEGDGLGSIRTVLSEPEAAARPAS